MQLRGALHLLGRAVRQRERPPRYLLVLAVLPAPQASFQLYPVLLDTEQAGSIVDRARSGDGERVEAAIFETSVRAPAKPIADVGELDAYFASVFDQNFRGAFERSGHWQPYGALVIDSAVEGLSIELDGRTIGATSAGATQLSKLIPGDRTLVLRGPRGHVQSETVRIDTGGEVAVTALPPPGDPHIARAATLWTGAVVGVAGAVITGVALARAGDGVRGGCLVRPGDDPATCPQIGTLTFGYDAGAAPTTDPAAVNPSGVLMGPLGGALLLTGGTWAAGAALFGDDDDVPWWTLGIGLAAGALTYGLGAALDSR